MNRFTISDDKREIGLRLKQLREAMSNNSQQWFAEDFLGVSSTRWNNYELGKRIPDMEMKRILLSKIFGLTIDWIETGNPSGLSGVAAQIISRLPPHGGRLRRRRNSLPPQD